MQKWLFPSTPPHGISLWVLSMQAHMGAIGVKPLKVDAEVVCFPLHQTFIAWNSNGKLHLAQLAVLAKVNIILHFPNKDHHQQHTETMTTSDGYKRIQIEQLIMFLLSDRYTWGWQYGTGTENTSEIMNGMKLLLDRTDAI